MKKIYALICVSITAFVLAACTNVPTITLYIWTDYLDESLLAQFRAETGIRVRTVAYESNEQAISQLSSGGEYDLVVPSDYAIEELAEKDFIQPIDWERITSFDRDTDLAERLEVILDQLKEGPNGFDVLEYSVPYFWGNVGLLYNASVAGLSDDVAELGWAVLKESKYTSALYDTSREGYLPALKDLGYSVNTESQSEVNAATAWLQEVIAAQGSNLRYISSNILDEMNVAGDELYDIAVSFSGDAVYLMDSNDNLDFAAPESGTNIWIDGFVIPKNVSESQLDLIYQFINFMLEYDNAYQNTDYVGYSTPLQSVMDAILEDWAGDYEEHYNIVFRPQDETYRYSSINKSLIDTAWLQIRT